MKNHFDKKRLLFGAICLFLLLIGVLLYSNSKRSSSISDGRTQSTPTRQQWKTNVEPASASPMQRPEEAPSPVAAQAPEQTVRAAVEGKNVPVEFWGKIIDQDDAPLPGVRIKGRIRHWLLTAPLVPGSRSILKEAISGPDGQFEINGETGDVLTIEAMEKEGYEAAPNSLRSFVYNISTNLWPDPRNPVVLQMWKQGAREPLLTGSKFVGIIPDGRVYTFDLLKGTHVESSDAEGDLRVWVKRPASVKFGEKYDWSFAVEPVNGGIIRTYEDVYVAPKEGYQNSYSYGKIATNTPWSAVVRNRFVMHSRNGQVYGRLQLNIYATYDRKKDDGSIDLKYWVNPSASRILR